MEATFYKIDWHRWDGADRLTIQARALRVDLADWEVLAVKGTKSKIKADEVLKALKGELKDPLKAKPKASANKTLDGYDTVTRAQLLAPLGSVRFTFQGVATQAQVDAYVQQVSDGILR